MTNFHAVLPILQNDILYMLNALRDKYESEFLKHSPIGSMKRALNDVRKTQISPKVANAPDSLMVQTLELEEGSFEKVRFNLPDEQGQSIRQLISSRVIQRVGMCCISSVYGKKQHLVLGHEKAKIFILQLSTLFKQVDASKRKLTLTRISTVPMPFTVLSMAANVCNDDYLAVCGFRDCHVLTFNNVGVVTDHIVLHPQLETGNFILKAIWLPGSQTQLAVLTGDFIKIYDLSVDITAPTYYFLVPSGKVRDCTFIFYEAKKCYYILIMSSLALIYCEMLNDASSAKQGSFYVTNTLEVASNCNPETGSTRIAGVSIYYSHCLGLLFCSFMQGNFFFHLFNLKKVI